jgi:multiple sugar transport system substrate-binding protein
MKRFLLLAIMACVVLPFGFAAPSSFDFYYGMTGPDGAYIVDMVNAYQKAHPGITVNAVPYAWDTLWTKLDAAYAAGNPPLAFALHETELGPYADKGVIIPLDQKLAALKFNKNLFIAGTVETGMFGGKQYSLPINVHPVAMYYNVDMFKAAGLDPNKPPTTYDQLVQYGKKLTKAGGAQWGVGLEQKNDIQFYGFMSFFYQNNGQLLTPDNKKSLFDGAPARKTLAQLHDLIWKHKITPLGEEDARADFRNKTVAIVFSGPWDNALESGFPSVAGLNYKTAKVPQFGPTPATWESTHQIAVVKQKDKSLEDVGAEFAKFFAENSIIWNQSGMIPVLKAAAGDPRLAKLKEYSKGFMDSLSESKMMPIIPKGYIEMFGASPDRPVMQAIQAYLMDENPNADQILGDANKAISAILKRFYP